MAGIQYEQMTGNVVRGDYANGNYSLVMADGSPTKIFIDSVYAGRMRNDFFNTYFNKDYMFREVYQKLQYGEGGSFHALGDSTSANASYNYILKLTQRLAVDFPNTQFEYIAVAQTEDPEDDGTLYPPTVINPIADPTERRYIQSIIADTTPNPVNPPTVPDDGLWTEATLDFETAFSGLTAAALAAGQIKTVGKWWSTTADSSFQLDNYENTLRLRIITGDGSTEAQFFSSDLFLGAVESDFFELRIKLDMDVAGDSVCTFYRSTDNRATWVEINTHTTGSVVSKSINKSLTGEYAIAGLANWTTQNGIVKVHRFAMRNGIDGEYISTPHSVDNWDFNNDPGHYFRVGGNPIFTVVNGSIGGYDYDTADATPGFSTAIIQRASIPEPQPLYYINLGLNQGFLSTSDFQTKMDDFFTRVIAVANQPNFITSTQNPRYPDNPEYSDRKATDRKASLHRAYAYNNVNVGNFDLYMYMVNTIPNFETYYVDIVHFDEPMHLIITKYLYSVMSGEIY